MPLWAFDLDVAAAGYDGAAVAMCLPYLHSSLVRSGRIGDDGAVVPIGALYESAAVIIVMDEAFGRSRRRCDDEQASECKEHFHFKTLQF